MRRGMAVLRSVGLALGLLMALGGSASAQVCQCTYTLPPVMCAALDFDGVLIGNGKFMTTTVFGAATIGSISTSASISGPNAIEFSLVSPAGGNCGLLSPTQSCDFTVLFTPLGCGTRTATLTVTFHFDGLSCDVVIPLRGFGCSFDCAIDATQTASVSPTVRDRILRELFLAQSTTGATRCSHLNCALCLAQPEALRGRAGAQAIVDQINCLLVVFCSVSSLVGV
jgi:hypothetical protein